MASQEKEMGLADLENFLKQQFPNSNKVNILLEQVAKSKADLEKEIGEANPFFYDEFCRQIRASGDMNLEKWVDSKGNVNVSKINTVVKTAKERYEHKKFIQEKEEQKKRKEKMTLTEEDIVSEFDKINFNNMSLDNILFVADNIEYFMEHSNINEFNQYNEKMNKILGTSQSYAYLEEALKNPESFTEERKEYIKQNLSSKEYNKFFSNGELNKDEVSEIYIIKNNIGKMILRCYESKGKNITIEDAMLTIREYKSFIEEHQGLIDIDHFVELANNGKLEEELKQHTQDTSKSAETFNEMDAKQLESFFDNVFENAIDPATMENKEAQLQADSKQEPTEKDETNVMEGQVSILEEIPMQEDIVQEDLEQEAYEAPTFEEEKTGIAKLFEVIKNLRPVQAIRKVFAPREEQKKLNAPTSQRTENGVRYTEYEENGSLLPMNIRARNFVRDFSLKAVEVLTNGINNLTGGNKQEDVVINRPTVIKTMEENTPEQAKEIIVQPEPIRNAVDRAEPTIVRQDVQKRDDNPWAVAAKSNMEEIAMAQTRENEEDILNENEQAKKDGVSYGD